MRYLFGFLCVCALGLMPLMGCSETSGEGGAGGIGGFPECEVEHDCDDGNQCAEGAWVDDACRSTAVDDGTPCDDENECTVSACTNGVCDSTPVQDGILCAEHPYADSEGTCIEGRCTVACDTAEDCIDVNECAVGVCTGGTCDSTPVQNGTLCSLFFEEGNCFAGQCTGPCDTAEDCMDVDDCTENSCLQVDGGSRCDGTVLPDGTTCAGGTCQVGACQVTRLDIPCTEQGYRNAVSAGCGPYTFDCDGPTELGVGVLFSKDVILDGGGNLTVEGGLVAPGVSVELRGFVIFATRGIHNFGGDLRVINSTVTNDDEAVVGDIGLLSGAALTLRGCTVLGSEEMEILSDDGDTLIANSTLSFGSQGSGLTNVSADGELTVTNSSLRSRGSNPVIAVTGDAPPAMVTATIVDGDCVGLIDSGGYNIESPGDTCGFDQGTDQVEVTEEELNLGPLQDNGGPTMTHALGAGSVAIDHIPAVDCEVDVDQRGQPRPETGGTMCDVGAFEVQP
jgi:hypothetical protein